MIPSTFFIKSYGCQMNIYDSEKITSILEDKGLKQNKDVESADLVVFNTCNIRDKAAHKLYSDIGRVNKCKKEKYTNPIGFSFVPPDGPAIPVTAKENIIFFSLDKPLTIYFAVS